MLSLFHTCTIEGCANTVAVDGWSLDGHCDICAHSYCPVHCKGEEHACASLVRPHHSTTDSRVRQRKERQ